jgi:hypothetical protein
MKPEKQQLLHDLLDGDSHDESTLSAAMKILRRRRQWRTARQTFALLLLVAAAGWLAEQKNQRPMPAHPHLPQARLSAPAPAQSLTDEQLLALFPNTPVGLATLPNGKKLLLFPKPADEARYVTRL